MLLTTTVEDSESAEFTFEIINDSGVSREILQVSSSCGCTDVRAVADVVGAKSRVRVTGTVTSKNRGPQEASIRVFFQGATLEANIQTYPSDLTFFNGWALFQSNLPRGRDHVFYESFYCLEGDSGQSPLAHGVVPDFRFNGVESLQVVGVDEIGSPFLGRKARQFIVHILSKPNNNEVTKDSLDGVLIAENPTTGEELDRIAVKCRYAPLASVEEKILDVTDGQAIVRLISHVDLAAGDVRVRCDEFSADAVLTSLESSEDGRRYLVEIDVAQFAKLEDVFVVSLDIKKAGQSIPILVRVR